MQDFKRLRVWQLANVFSVAVYSATRVFPPDERFGLTAQLRRAVVSIQSNIAEGCGRGTRTDTARMLQIAIGSAAEVHSQLYLSRDLGFLKQDDYEKLEDHVNHIRRMLIRLLFKLRTHGPQP
jgi:four helix bundle protein